MQKTGLLYSDVFLKHLTGEHPERKERLLAIMDYLKEKHILEKLVMLEPRPASTEDISSLHTREHISFVEQSCLDGLPSLDLDTIISHESYNAACLAVGGVLSAIDAVMDGNINNAFCAVRPPGHHAEREHAMGFCLFNNVAVGARYIQRRHGLEKVLIVDWDVHHGNGTANSFYDDPSVFYFSIHQYPHYPGTGCEAEQGKGKGKGTTLNLPLSGGAGDDEYIRLFEERLAPAAQKFEPDFILISAGFDAHNDDFLSSMNVTSEGFREMTRIVCRLARLFCNGRVVSMLEGGYNLHALAESVGYHIEELMM